MNLRISYIVSSNLAAPKFRAHFVQWQKVYREIYPKDELVLQLYLKHLVLAFSLVTVLTVTHLSRIHSQKISLQSQITSYFTQLTLDLALPEYFQWIFQVEDIYNLQHDIFLIFTAKQSRIDGEDLFAALYQQLIANTTRHPQGEFYTPPDLADLMVKDAYRIGDHVLDPACGSGTFLLAVANYIVHSDVPENRQIEALQKLVGVDINPLACLMSRTNLHLFYHLHFPNTTQQFSNQIYCQNALFPSLTKSPLRGSHFDLVIGNPPWLVLNRIPSQKEKDRVKLLGKQLGILRGGKLATSTELTTIFIYAALRDMLKLEGTIFVVTPASLATGSQHELFRQFAGMNKIEFWDFDTDLFRIHNLCFRAQKKLVSFHIRGQVSWCRYRFNQGEGFGRFEKLDIREYIPSTIKYQKRSIPFDAHIPENAGRPVPGLHIGRLIPRAKKTLNSQDFTGLPAFFFQADASPYKREFRQGASLVPRNLLFVDEVQKESDKDLVTIIPSTSIQSKKYSTWEFQAFTKAKVERQYIFLVAKSTGLLPFHYGWTYSAFLPLERSPQGDYQVLPPHAPNAHLHFHHLTTLYRKHLKPGAKITSLVDRINYGHALTHQSQWQTPKVVYNAIGSIVKAALITQPTVVDTSLYFLIPRSTREAYFLLGYLNSGLVTVHVKQVGSTGAGGSLRNIHKHPLNFALPHFLEMDPLHQQIADLALQMESVVKQFVFSLSQADPKLLNKPKSLQLRLFKDEKYKKNLREMDRLIRRMMSLPIP